MAGRGVLIHHCEGTTWSSFKPVNFFSVIMFLDIFALLDSIEKSDKGMGKLTADILYVSAPSECCRIMEILEEVESSQVDKSQFLHLSCVVLCCLTRSCIFGEVHVRYGVSFWGQEWHNKDLSLKFLSFGNARRWISFTSQELG